MSKMLMQHEIVAVEKGAKARYEEAKSSAYQLLQRAELLDGMSRKYTPKDDDGDPLPSEQKLVQLRVPDVLSLLAQAEANLFDVVATKDWGNCTAKADVVVNGKTLISQAPVTYLLWLKHQLEDLHTLISKLPTLDPAEEWMFSENQGLFATAPVQKAKHVRVKKPMVLYPATAEHPAQTQLVEEEVLAGHYTTIRYSGALPVGRKRQLLERVHALQDAVQRAREQANATRVEPISVGTALMEWVFAP